MHRPSMLTSLERVGPDHVGRIVTAAWGCRRCAWHPDCSPAVIAMRTRDTLDRSRSIGLIDRAGPSRLRRTAWAAAVVLCVVGVSISGGCTPPRDGRRCDGALPLRCVIRERCVYVSARGCAVCRCEEPAFVPLGRE